jgi:hypothetical protein
MRKIRWTAAELGLLLTAVLFLSGRPFPSSPATAWNIRLTITVSGEYALEGRALITGRYRMTFVWTGGLECDGDDYILIHGRSELTDWKAVEESLNAPEAIPPLTTDDFSEKPELNVLYVLCRGDGLALNFFIRGFIVPRRNSEGAFYLNLPASGENADRESTLKYNAFVKTGSNDIVLDDPATHPGARTKTFHWTWYHRGSLPLQVKTLVGTSRHEADVTVVVTPKE